MTYTDYVVEVIRPVPTVCIYVIHGDKTSYVMSKTVYLKAKKALEGAGNTVVEIAGDVSEEERAEARRIGLMLNSDSDTIASE